MINIFILARGRNAQALNEFFGGEEEYRIVGTAYDADKANYALKIYKRVILIFDYYEDTASLFNEITTNLKHSNKRLIAICSDVKEGFGLLGKGADDICLRPKTNNATERYSFYTNLNLKITKLVKDYDNNPRVLKKTKPGPTTGIIAIGSSTGGTECIMQILKAMPVHTPPILVVQHMPPVFTGLYSKRLDSECKISVWEAKDGDVLENGLALIAPGDKQMRLEYKNGRYCISCTVEKPHGGHIPAVDVLFFSIAQLAPKNTIGIILTGMGRDGARGLLAMREAGAFTLGQDEDSSIVYGMPKVAYEMGAVMRQGNPDAIISAILSRI